MTKEKQKHPRWDALLHLYEQTREGRPHLDYLETVNSLAKQLADDPNWNWLYPSTSMMSLMLWLPESKWPDTFIGVCPTLEDGLLKIELWRKVGTLEKSFLTREPMALLPGYLEELKEIVAQTPKEKA